MCATQDKTFLPKAASKFPKMYSFNYAYHLQNQIRRLYNLSLFLLNSGCTFRDESIQTLLKVDNTKNITE